MYAKLQQRKSGIAYGKGDDRLVEVEELEIQGAPRAPGVWVDSGRWAGVAGGEEQEAGETRGA